MTARTVHLIGLCGTVLVIAWVFLAIIYIMIVMHSHHFKFHWPQTTISSVMFMFFFVPSSYWLPPPILQPAKESPFTHPLLTVRPSDSLLFGLYRNEPLGLIAGVILLVNGPRNPTCSYMQNCDIGANGLSFCSYFKWNGCSICAGAARGKNIQPLSL